jgi:hypothetical protein
MNAMPYQDPALLSRWQRPALIVGVIGLLLSIGGVYQNPEQFYRSYLMSYLFWAGITLGCLGLLMIQYLTGGAWGVIIRRILEASTRTLPVVALAFVPILAGMSHLYEWTHPEVVSHSELLQHKQAYLNIPFFMIRLAIYFLLWFGLVFFLNRWSTNQDRSPDPRWNRSLIRLSGPGLVVYGLTLTFASVDWVMSLHPEWYSTIFGALIFAGQALTSMAFILVVIICLSRQGPLEGVLNPRHFWDLGKFLFVFVLLWAYLSFSQLLIIWSGNLPEETPWYLSRWHGGWQWVGIALVFFHFALPFGLLLSRELKKNSAKLLAVAIGIFLIRWVDLFWLTAPTFHPSGLKLHWLDFVAPIGLGGIWLAAFLRQLKRYPLLPINDPHLAEALQHGKP